MRKFFPIIVFVAVALVSLAMAGFAYVAAQDAARFKFEAIADDALNRIDGRLDLDLSLMRSAQATFAAQGGSVSRNEFNAFYKSLDMDRNYPGLRGIGFIRLIKPGDEADVEGELVREFGIHRALFPPSDLDWRTPIVLLEPLDSVGLTRLGYDLFTEPVRRAAIVASMPVDEPRATGRVLLSEIIGAESGTTGFLVFSRFDKPTAPGAEKPAPAGFIVAAFSTSELFQTALGRTPLLPVNVEVFDGPVGDENLLFRSETPPDPAFGDDFLISRETEVAGRPWTIRFRPTSAFVPPSSPVAPLMLGLFGLLFAGALALSARYQQRAFEAAAKLHEATEKSLLEKDLMLQEMKHRIKNSIARVLAMARQTAVHAKNVDEFSASFSARLQAMAASQDMLTRSRWQKADLGELLRIELGQVFGKDLPDGILNGPPVELDETTTQALGLTFHELATNALKYGEAANSVGVLKVHWKLIRQGKASRLALSWAERGGNGVNPPQKTGFGTKLIDMNIVRELDGNIARSYGADGLRVEIDIPYRA